MYVCIVLTQYALPFSTTTLYGNWRSWALTFLAFCVECQINILKNYSKYFHIYNIYKNILISINILALPDNCPLDDCPPGNCSRGKLPPIIFPQG